MRRTRRTKKTKVMKITKRKRISLLRMDIISCLLCTYLLLLLTRRDDFDNMFIKPHVPFFALL